MGEEQPENLVCQECKKTFLDPLTLTNLCENCKFKLSQDQAPASKEKTLREEIDELDQGIRTIEATCDVSRNQLLVTQRRIEELKSDNIAGKATDYEDKLVRYEESVKSTTSMIKMYENQIELTVKQLTFLKEREFKMRHEKYEPARKAKAAQPHEDAPNLPTTLPPIRLGVGRGVLRGKVGGKK